MTRRHKHKSSGKSLTSLYLWHRWIGMASAVFVILLSVTGLVLNHTDELALDSSYVKSPGILDWYGISAPDDITSYNAGPVSVSSIGKQVYIGTSQLPHVEPPVTGALLFSDFIVVTTADKLLLLTLSGELVEQLGRVAGIPDNIYALGKTPDNQMVLQSANGYHVTDSDMNAWQVTTRADATWSEPVTPTGELIAALQQNYRGTGLPVERVLLDLHSGRFFGGWGVYLMDGAAIVFILLAASGIWLWGRRRASARAHRRRQRGDGS